MKTIETKELPKGMTAFMLHEIPIYLIGVKVYEVVEAIKELGLHGRLTTRKARIWTLAEVEQIKAWLESRS